MRLIDADAFKEYMRKALEETRDYYPDKGEWAEDITEQFCKDIDDQPTVEPERKKGKWIHGREIAREMIGDCTTAIFYDGWTCSECGCLVEREHEPLYKYCPQCGSYNGGGKDALD